MARACTFEDLFLCAALGEEKYDQFKRHERKKKEREMASQVQHPSGQPNFKPERSKRGHKQSNNAAKRPGMSEEHLADIRKLPCCVCLGAGGTAHHVKVSGNRGMAIRGLDKDTLPLCWDDHLNGVEKAGTKNEIAWFKARGVDALDLMVALWMARGDLEKMRRLVLEHRKAGK